jgi:hypothetical protein
MRQHELPLTSTRREGNLATCDMKKGGSVTISRL